ncbi:MAG: hypothetical protein ABEJ75_01640 [Candidatus Nanohaloarchaea archaeon]
MSINIDFPQSSRNVHRGDWNFWKSLGADIDSVSAIQELRNQLYTVPAARMVKDSVVVNRYGKDQDVVEGEIGLGAVSQMLDGPDVPEELVVRMFPENEWPSETYDAFLEVVDPSEGRYGEDAIEFMDDGYLLVEEFPDDFDTGLYDMYVLSEGGYMVPDSGDAVDLDEWV